MTVALEPSPESAAIAGPLPDESLTVTVTGIPEAEFDFAPADVSVAGEEYSIRWQTPTDAKGFAAAVVAAAQKQLAPQDIRGARTGVRYITRVTSTDSKRTVVAGSFAHFHENASDVSAYDQVTSAYVDAPDFAIDWIAPAEPDSADSLAAIQVTTWRLNGRFILELIDQTKPRQPESAAA